MIPRLRKQEGSCLVVVLLIIVVILGIALGSMLQFRT